MGSMDYDDNGKKPRSDQQQQRRSRAMVLLLVLTNLTSILLFSGAGAALHAHIARHYPAAIHGWGSSKLLRELNVTGLALAASHAEVADLSSRLTAANKQLESILRGGSSSAATKRAISAARDEQRDATTNGLWRPDRLLSAEVRRVIGPHKLRRHSSSAASTSGEMAQLFPAVGQACHRHISELKQYMNYTPGGECPSDEAFAQRLMLKGCEPLPRRRCRPRTPAGYVEPTPLPTSLWSIPPDTSIVWDAYSCKSYGCLVNRGKTKGSYDCKDCFDLAGRERHRWMRRPGDKNDDDDNNRNSLDYTIDGVLSLMPKGTVRIGVDIGGGSGTFAARMKERGVTVVTTSMNFDGPFCSFVSSRGLVAMHVSVAERLPFPDGTMDIVHSMHVLSSWIPDVALEMALFDVFRVLRPGGVFWLDHFFCLGSQMEVTYVPMFERIGFEKVRWNAGRKLDRGVEMDEWYISALLRKPRR
ncbi:unnamed protein product [Urochloa humidicola]